jgi:hypothetical protein
MAGLRVARPPIGPVPDETHATFERALAREVLKSERLRIFMLVGVLTLMLGFYLVVPTAVP